MSTRQPRSLTLTYEVRFLYTYEGEAYGTSTAKMSFPTSAEAEAYAALIRAGDEDAQTMCHPDFRYLHPEHGIFVWRVWHHEEKVT